ncbi:MAG: galactokinase [Flavobacteriaceae bacterium]|nr:galactokinase [Flavobacteriaceae bacterium]
MANNALAQKVELEFQKRFGKEPLLIFSPGRINLIGEHTDYNNGFVFPAAIDKGIVCAIQKNNKDSCEVYAIDKNRSETFLLDHLKPVTNNWWLNYVLGVVSGVQEKSKLTENFDIVFAGDLPSGAGLSSSAALENSIVFGLNELFDLKLSKKEMIAISQKAEHDFVEVKCGIMDQFASMFGVQDSALLLDCKTLASKTYQVKFNQYKLLLINTNVKHSLADSAYNDRRNVCESVAAKLGVTSLREVAISDLQSIEKDLSEADFQKALYVLEENRRVLAAAESLEKNDLKRFGELLFASHNGLQQQYNVSCAELDFLVSCAKESAAVIGARMMGGGFGGCTINLLKATEIEQFKKEVEEAYIKKFYKPCSFYTVTLGKGVFRVN